MKSPNTIKKSLPTIAECCRIVEEFAETQEYLNETHNDQDVIRMFQDGMVDYGDE